MSKTKKQPRDYETALARLEEITDRLESGDASLDEAIALYSEGLEIAAFCDKKLNEAEAKIKIVTEKNSRLTEELFADDETDDDTDE